ncbi:MAG: alpha/beta fold hydrolase [Halanaerobiales bacterium]|nr:alpha/beta fold hydrolase [Halanaerobiales bacterium]
MKKTIKYLIIITIVILVIGFGGITYFTNTIINQQANTRVIKNSDLIEEYSTLIDQVETTTSDDLKINSWRFTVDNPEGVVVVIHGMHGQDASSLLEFGKFFYDNNYETFCIDLRAHGKSEGDEIGFGYTETRDLNSLLDWIKIQPKYKDKEVILFGLSMGGATAINTAPIRSDIDKIISVSSFASYERTFLDYMRKDEVPEFIVQAFKPSIRMLLSLKYNTSPTKNSPAFNIKDITIPTLLIHGSNDQQVSVDQAYELKENGNENVELWVVKDFNHLVVTDILDDENDWYRDRLINFIKK